MNKNYKTIATILIIAAVTLTFLHRDCHLVFQEGVESETIIKSLLNFVIVAVLIERFCNMLILPESRHVYKRALRALHAGQPSFLFKSTQYDSDPVEGDFKRKFVWVSFSIGLVISAIGLRYFSGLLEFDCSDDLHGTLFIAMDIFLSAILMSGGSTFIMRIIDLIPENNA